MRTFARSVVVTALVAGTLLGVARPAQAATINVGPGQSIQAAINRAAPGTTINVAAGTYREALIIRKDGIKLRGAGDGDGGTVLAPPASANNLCSFGPDIFSGICVVAKKLDSDFNVVTPVSGVEVSGFLVNFFPGDGIVTFGADHATFEDNTAARNGGYGITSFVSTGNVFNRLVARNNEHAPGFYIGDSPNADFILKNSLAVGNALGILVREANNGQLVNNSFTYNCAGIFFENHGNDPAFDIRVQNWSVRDNRVLNNVKVCTDEEGNFGGVGLVMFGTKNVTVEDNEIRGNQRVDGSPFGGGVLLQTGAPAGGNPPVGNTIRNNTILNNKPFDVRYDGTGSGNTFPGNTCNTSQPAYICD